MKDLVTIEQLKGLKKAGERIAEEHKRNKEALVNERRMSGTMPSPELTAEFIAKAAAKSLKSKRYLGRHPHFP